ncbi:phage Gp37/Gp68 family protein [Fluviicola sp.]|jgi:protein gp37|uniref:phage Gp37/Gp68 family protein n=1 Tax=Fluviicola sp. TaxID=1917219 RepID=UPI002821ADC9|nr:phage Gp37/Gp68 family protein [Fluviicola sp.]MDR0802657.1 phage Gp37/Gp68 family protein [Fluviicola sp.]
MKKSKIEWTEETWNPTTGCNKVSAGCKNCYAEIMANRLKAMGAPGYENSFEFTIMPERLNQPLRKKKPTKYFVNSMSDLFHEEMPIEFLDKIIDIINLTPQHIYQILTKREDAMFQYFSNRCIPENIWLGTSVENKKNGVPRIDKLKNINASIKFLSVEPLLEDLGKIDLTGIDWVIVGGESGTKARPMKKEWALNVKRQCEEQNVAFFFKQWGTWGSDGIRRSKKSNGRMLEGQEWNEYPESLAG